MESYSVGVVIRLWSDEKVWKHGNVKRKAKCCVSMRVTDPHVLRVFTEKGGVEVQRGNARSGGQRSETLHKACSIKEIFT